MTTKLDCFTQWVAQAAEQGVTPARCTALMGLIAQPQGLAESFQRQSPRKAAGMDGVRKADYGCGLESRLADLSARLRRMAWHPQPARRVYIPKAGGGLRPLGLPSFEDRLVQDRLAGVLQAIWEPMFRDCSFGFRPGRSAHQALARLDQVIREGATQWIVEADIKGFFDSVNHEHLMRFVEHRVADPNVLRLIRRLLRAGVVDAGQFHASEQGTPQGGLVSPVLANIYLHYVLDLWFERQVARKAAGRAHLVRYADDFVACFERETDARAFLTELQARLAQFGLQVEPTKTALMRFGSMARAHARRAQAKPASFNFLGLTHYVHTTRGGRFSVGRTTQRQRIGKKLAAMAERLKQLRLSGTKAMIAYVQQHVRGHIQYYGISGNMRALRRYVYLVSRLLFKWLNRRSQRHSLTWQRYARGLARWMPKPRIVHRFASTTANDSSGSRMV
jgi:group II intron reverse transcriptase/maturase